MFGAILQHPVTLVGVHPPCSILLMPKEFLTRAVFDFVLPCHIPMLGCLKCISAAPPGMLEFIGDLSLENQSVTRPVTKKKVTSSLGSYYIKCVGLLGERLHFMTVQISQPLCKLVFLSQQFCAKHQIAESSPLVLCSFSFAVFEKPILQGSPAFRAWVDSLGGRR